MSRKSDLLERSQDEELELNDDEKRELSSIMIFVEQSNRAQGLMLSKLANDVADRYEVVEGRLDLNMDEVMQRGVQAAKLIVKKI